MKNKIIKILKESENEYISGQDISNILGITRAGIWKYINSLKEDGYEIDSVTRKGYKLINSPDILTYEEVHPYIDTKYIGRTIHYFNSIDSTNVKAKELAVLDKNEGAVVISEEQTLGRGRLGRKWISPKYTGIWMSVILKPDIDPMNVAKITLIGAAAVASALDELGISCGIKWPNDIVLNNKKVCGILTEMSGELGRVNYVIMGIGINVNLDKDDFTEELKDTATSLKIENNFIISRKKLLGKIFNNFERLYEEFKEDYTIKSSIEICKEKSILLGKEVKIINRKTTYLAKAIDIDEDGRLVVENNDGSIEKIFSGEVSIRGLYGYI